VIQRAKFPAFAALAILLTSLVGISAVRAAAPAVPTNVTVQNSKNADFSNGSLVVSWNAVTGATAYSARITDANNTSKIVSTVGNNNTQATFSGLVGGAAYVVQVRSVSGLDISDWSSSSLQATPLTFPKVPGVPTVVAGIGEATVSWKDLTGTDTGGYPISSYLITETVSGKTASALATDSSLVMKGLTNGAKIQFTVTAITAAGSTGAT